MKIGIIELCSNTHYTALMAGVRVFQEKDNEITIFVNKDMIENLKGILKEGEVEVIVRKKNESMYRFLKKIEKYRFDILFITTIQGHFIPFLLFNPKKTHAKVFVTFHNANLWLEKYKFDGLKGLIKHSIRCVWKKMIYGACVDSDNAKDYILRRFNFKKPIMVIPFILYEGATNLSGKENYLRVSIPGTLSEERREYLKVLEEFEKIPKEFREKICLELLGSPNKDQNSRSNEIIAKCKSLKSKDFNLIFHEKFLSPKKYSEGLMKADIICGPIKMKDGYSSSKRTGEVYGVSKDTGVNFNMICGAKPGLFPKGYKNLKELESSTIYFDDYENAFNILIELSKNKKRLDKLKNEAAKNSTNFSPSKIRERLKEIGILR